jgi:glycosyltransferase involved in cell wall biosynthesis
MTICRPTSASIEPRRFDVAENLLFLDISTPSRNPDHTVTAWSSARLRPISGPLKGVVRRVKLSIIIPAYNEEATIAEILRRVQAVQLEGIQKEILVVDDASADRTASIASSAGIRVIRHEHNKGKGGAVKTGIASTTGDIVLIQDADLEYDPRDYTAVIQPIVSGAAVAVMGSRFLTNRLAFWGKNRSPYFIHYLGNKTIVTITNLLYGQSFTDYEGCYKAFSRSLLKQIEITANGFEFDNELMCKIFRNRATVMEVPIHYQPRSYANGKKITWRHGLIMLQTIVKWRLLSVDRVAVQETRSAVA